MMYRMLDLPPLVPPLTDEDATERSFLRSLLATTHEEAFRILIERIEDEEVLSAMMTFLDMTGLVIEASAAAIQRHEALTADQARDKSITALMQWLPAPLVLAFSLADDTQSAMDWLQTIKTQVHEGNRPNA